LKELDEKFGKLVQNIHLESKVERQRASYTVQVYRTPEEINEELKQRITLQGQAALMDVVRSEWDKLQNKKAEWK
jgi:hypothetical protein